MTRPIGWCARSRPCSRPRRASGIDDGTMSRSAIELMPASTAMGELGATLVRAAFVIGLTLPPVRRAFTTAGLGWVYLVVLAFALAIAGVPVVRALARVCGVLDTPTARKVHTAATPLLGGAAVYAAFAATV